MLQRISTGLHRASGGVGSPERSAWRSRRRALERGEVRQTVLGPRSRGRWLKRALPVVEAALRMSGIYHLGMRNAASPTLARVELRFADLPAAFDGYRILHLTDTHFETLPQVGEAAARCLHGHDFDLAVLTGDYQRGAPSDPVAALAPLRTVLQAVTLRDGLVATLGNHDTSDLVPVLEELGATVLINEHAVIRRNQATLALAGTDDVSCFYTAEASACLENTPEGFRIALVHSPELAQAAVAAGFSLYLSGHTHGGQICLPGGRPILTCLAVNRAFARGLWRCGDMIGYTSAGLGSTKLPVRFACPPEIVSLVLRSESAGLYRDSDTKSRYSIDPAAHEIVAAE